MAIGHARSRRCPRVVDGTDWGIRTPDLRDFIKHTFRRSVDTSAALTRKGEEGYRQDDETVAHVSPLNNLKGWRWRDVVVYRYR